MEFHRSIENPPSALVYVYTYCDGFRSRPTKRSAADGAALLPAASAMETLDRVKLASSSSALANSSSVADMKAARLQAALARAGKGAGANALAGLLSSVTLSNVDAGPVSERHTDTLTLRHVILNPGQYLSASDVTVCGMIVVLDFQLQRLDLSQDGAKLIVDFAHLNASDLKLLKEDRVGIGSNVSVTGSVKKRERRTFMEAHLLALCGS